MKSNGSKMRVRAVSGALLALSIAMPLPAIAKDAPAIEVSDKGAFKGAGQVAVGAFNVGFIFESIDATAATGGLIGAFGGTTKAKSELTGVTPAMMQQIVDAAYADFTERLAASGLTVVPAATVFGSAELAKLKGASSPSEINIALEKNSKGKAQYFKPSQLPVQVFLPGDFTGSGMSSMGLNIAAGQNSYMIANYAKASATPVVDVTYLIDFSDQKRPGAWSFGSLQVNANLSVVPGFSRMTVIGANGKTNTIKFGQPVSVEGDFIEKNDASSGGDKAMQSAANVAGGVAAVMGLGGLRFGKTRKFAFAAKPGNYEEGAAKVASLANEKAAAALTSSR